MRIFKSKLFFIISLIGLSSSSAMVWSTIQNNKKYGELNKKVNKLFFDIFKNYNSDYKKWRLAEVIGGDSYDEKKIDEEIKLEIHRLLRDYVYSDFSLFEKKIEQIGINKIKDFWYLTCELSYVSLKYSKKNEHKKVRNINDDKLKKSIYNFAKKFDSDYVDKNTEKVKKRINEFVDYFLISKNDDIEKTLMDKIDNLSNSEKLRKLWKEMKPLFDVMPTLADDFYFMWSTRFVKE